MKPLCLERLFCTQLFLFNVAHSFNAKDEYILNKRDGMWDGAGCYSMVLKFGWHHFGKAIQFTEEERRSSFLPCNHFWEKFLPSSCVMSSWQLHGVINRDMGLQLLNLLMKVKTETENKLAESYMKKQSPQTSTCAQHSCLSSQAAADVISQAEKQMLALSPRLLTFHHSSHEFSYDCMSLKKQILPFCCLSK